MEQSLISTIPCPVRKAAVADPDSPALIDDSRCMTYAQLDAAIDNAADYLQKREITAGDIVAVLANNSINYAILCHAAFRLGFVLMPLNTRLTQADWRKQLNQARCRHLICGPNYRIADVECLSLDDVTSDNNGFKPVSDRNKYSLNREALIIFTSGSRGESRGAVLTWRNLYYSALGAASVLNCQPNDQWLAVLPFFHVGGISILFRAVLAGCSVRIMNHFDANYIIGIIEERKGQYLSVVPTMLRELMSKDSRNRLHFLKAIIVGGAPFDESLRQETIKRKLPALTTYGMTETSSMVTLLAPNSPTDKFKTSGTIMPYRELMITDDCGISLPPNQSGRIMIRGEVLFARYLNQKQAPLDAEGWFETGDIGRLNSDGFLTVTGRADNIIISGGENINLDQIEQAIGAVPGIAGVVVLSRKDKKWGERPVAVVERSDDSITERYIKDQLHEMISAIMIPDHIIITDKLPRTGVGKYDRQKLYETYKALLDGDS